VITISVFDIFRIGLGPSSSHTCGPMRAAAAFAGAVAGREGLARIEVRLLGSLAWTGRGHATDRAVVWGLAGLLPETADPDQAAHLYRHVAESGRLPLNGGREIAFDPARDIVFDRESPTPEHPNTLIFTAWDEEGRMIVEETWLSPGGGFIRRAGKITEGESAGGESGGEALAALPYPYDSASQLLAQGEAAGLSLPALIRANEEALGRVPEIDAALDAIIAAMFGAIERGLAAEGELPGGLRVRRRARGIAERLRAEERRNDRPPHAVMDWVSVYAMAVNEENAAGGRVVTAPTNGAAGVVPAVLRYYRDFCPGASAAGMRDFLLVAGAIGALFKAKASISGAEVGCQGEVGVAAAMAAGGLAAALGGSAAQIENAAEIGMEHHLGLTCDPVGGLVQIPCIERNGMAAIKAVGAASLALRGDGEHRVSLDQVMATMRATGADMSSKYKETAQGGLAVAFTAC
jgi:L-serine dehydratase